MAALVEKFFIPKPEATTETVPCDLNPKVSYRLFLDGDEKVKWSGDLDLPEIGDKVLIRMNSIGPGIVKGYFTSAGFLGVMVKPTKPPKWLVDQNKRDIKNEKTPEWRKENIACIFGVELDKL